MHRRHCLALVLLVALAAPASAQRLLLGSWRQTEPAPDQTTTVLAILSEDNDGRIEGVLHYDPPQDGFAGAPFTAMIENGGFTIHLINGTRYQDMHWCRDALCGTLYTPDETATRVTFERPTN
jgi:hypothetical protein